MSHRVLVVDDEDHILEVVKGSLEGEPYTLITTDSVKKALKTMDDEPVDVIVSDEIMPVMSGSELLKEVRRKHPDTMRILFTAYPTLKDATRAVEEGYIFNFLTKPFNPIDLAVSIRQALRFKDLLGASRRLLGLTRRQDDLLADLRKRCPSTAPAGEGEDGTVIVDDKDLIDWDLLKKKLDDLTRDRKKLETLIKRLEAGPLKG